MRSKVSSRFQMFPLHLAAESRGSHLFLVGLWNIVTSHYAHNNQSVGHVFNRKTISICGKKRASCTERWIRKWKQFTFSTTIFVWPDTSHSKDYRLNDGNHRFALQWPNEERKKKLLGSSFLYLLSACDRLILSLFGVFGGPLLLLFSPRKYQFCCMAWIRFGRFVWAVSLSTNSIY